MTDHLLNDPCPSSVTSTQMSKDVWGHPKGLWVLFWTEGWMSFSQYGMLAILVVYLKDIFQHPERAEKIIGLSALLSLNRFLYAPIGVDATAGSLSGLIMAVIFAAPFAGSFLADRGLGRTQTTLIGSILLTVSFALMSVERFFAIALLIFLIGVGLCGSLKAQVGALYSLEDRRRSDAYQIYTLSIQGMAIISPILCAFLGNIAWQWAFLTTAIGMAIALALYCGGRRYLPAEDTAKASSATETTRLQTPLNRAEKVRIVCLLVLVLVFAIGTVPNQEIMDGYLLWGAEHYQLTVLGIACPVSTLVSLDSIVSLLTGIFVLWFWQWYDRRYRPIHDMVKITIGSAIATIGPLFLAYPSWAYTGAHEISLWWGLAFHTLNDVGCSITFAIGLAFFSRYAPKQVNTILVSCFTLNIFFANLMVGKIATLLHRVPDYLFWGIHSGAALLSTLGMLAACLYARKIFSA